MQKDIRIHRTFDGLLCSMEDILEWYYHGNCSEYYVRHYNGFECNNFNKDHFKLNNINVCFGE